MRLKCNYLAEHVLGLKKKITTVLHTESYEFYLTMLCLLQFFYDKAKYLVL